MSPPLRSEHVVPYSLGGPLELVGASCDACATETAKIEGYMARTLWGNARMRANFPSRRRRARPATIPLIAMYEDHEQEIDVPVANYPAIAPMLWLPEPGVLGGQSNEQISATCRIFSTPGLSPEEVGAEMLRREGQLQVYTYARFIAKVAHSFAVTFLGVDGFEHKLPQFVLNTAGTDKLFDYVGGNPDIIPPGEPPDDHRHQAKIRIEQSPQGRLCVVVKLRLFDGWANSNEEDGIFGSPMYVIVAGFVNTVTQARLESLPFYPEAP